MTPPSAPNPLDLSTSPLALGCWGFADPDLWGNTGRSDAVAVIHAALDHGINLLDTAPGYGNGLSEEILGEALDGRRGQVLIATKVPDSAFSADGVRASLEASLRRLKTDWIDLLQIHWVGDEARFEEVIAAFESARDAGLVRACGVCNFGPRHLERLKACATGWVSNQLPYNLLWRAIEFEIQQRCVDEGLGILAYSPLQQGLLSGRYTTADDVPPGRARSRHFAGSRPLARHGEPGCEAETFRAIGEIRRIADEAGHPMPHLALAWLRSRPGVRAIIVGATRVEQIIENATATDLRLDEATLRALDEATEPLKAALGPNPDMWSRESRYR